MGNWAARDKKRQRGAIRPDKRRNDPPAKGGRKRSNRQRVRRQKGHA